MPGELLKLDDDNVFMRFFIAYAEKGTKIEKYRYKKPILGGAKSKSVFKLVKATEADAAIIYHNFSCPLINISQIYKGLAKSAVLYLKFSLFLAFLIFYLFVF